VSVRTTTVVGTGLAALAFIGVATIFGESLSALVAPPPALDSASDSASAAQAAGTPRPATTQPLPAGAAGVKVSGGGDGGAARTSPDGSS
jgi:hypothetical protein